MNAKQTAITAKQRQMLKTAEREKRRFTQAENREWDRLNAEFERASNPISGQFKPNDMGNIQEHVETLQYVTDALMRGESVEEKTLREANQAARVLTAFVEGQGGINSLRSLLTGPAQYDRVTPFLDAVYSVAEKGVGASAEVKGNLLSVTRDVMTPASNSAGNSGYQATDPQMYMQATGSTAIMREMTVIPARNNVRLPYIDRDNRLTAQNKGYTDQLSQQAYIVSQVTTAMQNYYALILWHNDVVRDQAGDVAKWVLMAAEEDIRRSILTDVLSGDGSSNNLTGLDNYAGVLSYDANSAAVSDWSFLANARKLLEDKNCDWESCSVLMSPAIAKQFVELADTTNQPLQLPVGLRNLASRWYVSSLVPEADGETVVYVGDFSKVDLFVDGTYTIQSRERYVDYDHSALFVCQRVDMKLREPDHMLRIINVATA